MKRPKLPRWKYRGAGFPELVAGEKPLGNGCECGGCLAPGEVVARCFDGVVRELCMSHYCSRNLQDLRDAT